MTPKQLLQRLILVVIIATVTSLSGGISAAWWSAGLLGLTLTLAFTFISERILRQRLFGKIGKGLITIYAVHLCGETVVAAALLWLFALIFGIKVVNETIFILAVAAVWLSLCKEAAGKIISLTLLYIATRK